MTLHSLNQLQIPYKFPLILKNRGDLKFGMSYALRKFIDLTGIICPVPVPG
jgi:hypothetical protein